MAYTLSHDTDRVNVALDGRLTFQEQAAFKQMIGDMQGAGSGTWFVDLSKVEFMDSAGLGLLLRLKKAADDAGSRLSLRVPGEGQIKRLMDVAKFSELVPIET